MLFSPASSTAVPFQLSARTLHWLLASIVLVSLPHATHLPVWALFFLLIPTAWRLLHQQGRIPLPAQWLKLAMLALLVAGILGMFHTLFGREAGVTLLVGLVGLKLLEINGARDVWVLLLLGYFLIITNLLYSQEIIFAAYLLGVMLVNTATLISLNDATQRIAPAARLRLAFALVALGLPLMVVLFVFFPRIEGPIWGLPSDAHSGVSGLSDTMSPGQLSHLALSDEVAFRVKFYATAPDQPAVAPPSSQLYWRGPVLWWTNGKEWRNLYQSVPGREIPGFFSEALPYTVTLEPHGKPWLFALDMVEQAPQQPMSFLTADYQLHARLPVNQLTRYTVASYLEYRALGITEPQRKTALRLPAKYHPRTRAQAAQWRAELGADDRAVVNKALQWFREQPFVYTLDPPELLQDPVDQFLFESRQGFCEHYASAFTVLMRAAGIPARIVTGYQGGEMNPVGKYLVVRQRDAHAWSEVWLEGDGWTRVDPTAMVSPDRIQAGLDSALPDSQFAPLGFAMNANSALAQWLRQIRNNVDAVRNGWNEWVLGYGPALQQQLMQELGWPQADYQHLTLFMFSALALLLLPMAAWLFYARALPDHDVARRQYARFCRKLARQGLPRLCGEGPLAYGQRIVATRPHWAAQVEEIIRLYLRLRYQRNPTPAHQRALAERVRRFRP